MIDANDKAKIEYGRDFDAVLDMTLFSLKDRVARELASRPTFRPSSFGIVVPRTAPMKDGKFGQYRYCIRSGEIPNSARWYKGLNYLAVYSGYIAIRGADDSTVFIDIQQTPNVPQLQGGTKRKNPHK